MNTNEAEKDFKLIWSKNQLKLRKTRIMIWTLKKVFALLFLAKLLWFPLSDDDTACLSS